jgi:threonine dehydratase
VGERPFEVIRRLVDDIVTVTDAELLDALALCWSRTKQLIEPTAASPGRPATGAARGRRVGSSSPAATSTPPSLAACLVPATR